MINETAFKYFGWDDLKNKRYNNGKEGGYEVIGVVKDFHIASLHQTIEPACIIFDIQHVPPSSISLRISKGAIRQTMAYLQKVWKEVYPDFPMNYQFYDEWFNQMYKEDDRFGDAIGLFALLAISYFMFRYPWNGDLFFRTPRERNRYSQSARGKYQTAYGITQ